MVEVLRERQIVDRSIGILFATNRQVEGFAQGFREKGIPVETRKNGLDFASQVPKVLTLHSAKGLTFDSVLMPRLVPGTFARRPEGLTNRLLYVGITRAIKWLYLSTVTGNPIPTLSRIRKLAELNPPVVTLGRRTAQTPSTPNRINQLQEDELLDIL